MRTRAGSKAIILMEDETHMYGVYSAGGTSADGGELYPARWDKQGHFMPQKPEGPEYKTALDIV